jgi:hypothetical protein
MRLPAPPSVGTGAGRQGIRNADSEIQNNKNRI